MREPLKDVVAAALFVVACVVLVLGLGARFEGTALVDQGNEQAP